MACRVWNPGHFDSASSMFHEKLLGAAPDKLGHVLLFAKEGGGSVCEKTKPSNANGQAPCVFSHSLESSTKCVCVLLCVGITMRKSCGASTCPQRALHRSIVHSQCSHLFAHSQIDVILVAPSSSGGHILRCLRMPH